MDIEILKTVLQQQLANNHINRGTKKAHEFEYAFVTGAMATFAANDTPPPAYLTMLLVSGRSLFDSMPASEALH